MYPFRFVVWASLTDTLSNAQASTHSTIPVHRSLGRRMVGSHWFGKRLRLEYVDVHGGGHHSSTESFRKTVPDPRGGSDSAKSNKDTWVRHASDGFLLGIAFTMMATASVLVKPPSQALPMRLHKRVLTSAAEFPERRAHNSDSHFTAPRGGQRLFEEEHRNVEVVEVDIQFQLAVKSCCPTASSKRSNYSSVSLSMMGTTSEIACPS